MPDASKLAGCVEALRAAEVPAHVEALVAQPPVRVDAADAALEEWVKCTNRFWSHEDWVPDLYDRMEQAALSARARLEELMLACRGLLAGAPEMEHVPSSAYGFGRKCILTDIQLTCKLMQDLRSELLEELPEGEDALEFGTMPLGAAGFLWRGQFERRK